MVGTLFGHCGAPELIAQFISTQYWPLEERSIELGKERGNKKLGVFPREVENTKQSPKVKEMRCISGERGRRTMVHILPTPRSQQITILTTLSGPPVPFLTQKHLTKTFQIFIQKQIYIFTASSWTYRNILIIEKNCHYQHELIVTTMSALVSFTKLEETLFQKE